MPGQTNLQTEMQMQMQMQHGPCSGDHHIPNPTSGMWGIPGFNNGINDGIDNGINSGTNSGIRGGPMDTSVLRAILSCGLEGQHMQSLKSIFDHYAERETGLLGMVQLQELLMHHGTSEKRNRKAGNAVTAFAMLPADLFVEGTDGLTFEALDAVYQVRVCYSVIVPEYSV
jgi:hypothetical protein